MKLIVPFVLLVLTCNHTATAPATKPSKASTDRDNIASPAETDNLFFTLVDQNDFRAFEGCCYLLWPEGGSYEKALFGFSFHYGTGEALLDGTTQIFEKVSETEVAESLGAVKTFIHTNDLYEVTTTVTFDSMHIYEEAWYLSGTVTFRELATGATLRVSVLGDQGC